MWFSGWLGTHASWIGGAGKVNLQFYAMIGSLLCSFSLRHESPTSSTPTGHAEVLQLRGPQVFEDGAAGHESGG